MPQYDDLEQYADLFESMHEDRQARRKKNPKANHRPKKAVSDVISTLADNAVNEVERKISYQPSQFEAVWLADSLAPFFERGLITDVLALVRGGKEASVYVCEASPVLNQPLVAAKVYRPRMFRQMRNDAIYREGREVLTSEGAVVKRTDHRVMRAMGKKSAFGMQVANTSWLMYEQQTLEMLHAVGVDVPTPISAASNALLMQYLGELNHPAPTLSMVSLEEDEALPLFKRVIRNIEVMLAHNVIHGDLSAYNILYWEGDITVIDFPQVTNPYNNANARAIFQRDVTRVCEYFADQGVDSDADTLAEEIWAKTIDTDG